LADADCFDFVNATDVSGLAMFLLMMLEMNSFGDIDRAAIFLGSC